MIRALTVSILLASASAWAVGENIAVTGPASQQLSQTLCISMDCVKAGADYTVSSKLVGSKMELKVTGPSGVRLSLLLETAGDGQLANSEAMSATSQLIQAIENPVAPKAPAAVEKPAAPVKNAKKLARALKGSKKTQNAVRVAARKLSRG